MAKTFYLATVQTYWLHSNYRDNWLLLWSRNNRDQSGKIELKRE